MAYTCWALPVALKAGVDAELLAAVLVAAVSVLTTRQAVIVMATARPLRPAFELFLFWVSWDTPTPPISFLWAAQPVENVVRAGQRGANRKGQRDANGKLAKLPVMTPAWDLQRVCRRARSHIPVSLIAGFRHHVWSPVISAPPGRGRRAPG